MIIAGGNVSIGSSGLITANGGNGANGGNAFGTAGGGGGGGGAGGGIVAICHGGTYSNSGSITVNGGAGGSPGTGGTGAAAGEAGSAGSIIIIKAVT